MEGTLPQWAHSKHQNTKRGWLIVFGQNTFFWSFCFEDLCVDFKEILNLHRNLFKNKLVGENAVARVHGSCSFRFMGSWHNCWFVQACWHTCGSWSIFFQASIHVCQPRSQCHKENWPCRKQGWPSQEPYGLLALLNNRPQQTVSVPK